MRQKAKIWLIRGVLVLNALVLLGSLVGSAYLKQEQPVSEKTEQNDSSEEHSTGSANFHFISCEAIVPGFHFYIPLIKEIVFEIESSTPYSFLTFEDDPQLVQNVAKVLFGAIICPNAP